MQKSPINLNAEVFDHFYDNYRRFAPTITNINNYEKDSFVVYRRINDCLQY